MRSIYPHAVDDLSADAFDGHGEVLTHGLGQNTRGDGNAAQVGHLVGLYLDLVAGIGSCRGAQDQMEDIFGVDCQARDLGSVHLEWLGDDAGLLAIAEEGQADEVGGRELNGVPLEDHRGLRGIAAS